MPSLDTNWMNSKPTELAYSKVLKICSLFPKGSQEVLQSLQRDGI